MNLLVIGGTRFFGRHFVDSALAGGHSVTLFNRAQSRTDPVPGTEQVTGDREHDIALLSGRKWDAVLDTCGFVPRIVGLSADALKDSVGTYLFISSISVYSDMETPMQNEDAPLIELADPTVEEINGETYGGLKVLCERRVKEVFGERAVTVRPGLIVGPYDSTDRFTYWPYHFAREGEFLAPDIPESPIQFVDGRDLGGFCLKLLEDGATGTYHACGPTPAYSFREFVSLGTKVFGDVAKPIWVDPTLLIEREVKAWEDLPVLSSLDGTKEAYLTMDNRRATLAGLRLRPLEETLKDSVQWWSVQHAGEELRTGLSPEREVELIKELTKRSAPS